MRQQLKPIPVYTPDAPQSGKALDIPQLCSTNRGVDMTDVLTESLCYLGSKGISTTHSQL